jgi:hypothetical protein
MSSPPFPSRPSLNADMVSLTPRPPLPVRVMSVSAFPASHIIEGPLPVSESADGSRSCSFSSPTLPASSTPLHPSIHVEKPQLNFQLRSYQMADRPLPVESKELHVESDPFLISPSHPTYTLPTAMSTWRKWLAVLAISSGSVCV